MSDNETRRFPQRRGRTGGRGRRGGRGGCGRTQYCSCNQNKHTPKFKGNITDLEGYTFDCSDYKQAEKYVSTIKNIAEYVGTEYKYGGDIRITLENEVQITIPQPVNPVGDPMPLLESRIFEKEIYIYMKRRSTLDENVQKRYSLVLGKCTDLLKSKLKHSNTWNAASNKYDVLILIRIIRTITFKFDEKSICRLHYIRQRQTFITSGKEPVQRRVFGEVQQRC